jgi:hypothetical protein
MSKLDLSRPWYVWRWSSGIGHVVWSTHRWRWSARVAAARYLRHFGVPGVAYLVKPRDDRASR